MLPASPYRNYKVYSKFLFTPRTNWYVESYCAFPTSFGWFLFNKKKDESVWICQLSHQNRLPCETKQNLCSWIRKKNIKNKEEG